MSAEAPLGPQFQFSWNERKGKKYKTKVEMTQHKVRTLKDRILLHAPTHYIL